MAERKGLILAAPRSGAGKTMLTIGIAAALAARGLAIAPAKTGPDYIDAGFLARAAGRAAINLDPWAMTPARLSGLAHWQADAHDLLLVEGVMGLFDGAADGTGSTADLAAIIGLPIVLVVDCERQAQSLAALVHGFATWRDDVAIAGVILNRVGSDLHEHMLRTALARTGIPCLGAIPRRADLVLPERHLGLVLPEDFDEADAAIARLADMVETHIALDLLLAMASPVTPAPPMPGLAPLGQTIAIAHDAAFAFFYPHMLSGWHEAGASLRFFSPLADEAPDPEADAVFLPGGYPELHGETLANAAGFRAGLHAARAAGALIYGECGGFMALGHGLVDRDGRRHAMAGLLPLETRIDRPRRVLGYRRLVHGAPLPWPAALTGHEFHYSSAVMGDAPPLFAATDALGDSLPPMGMRLGRVMGSYAHVIDGGTR